jgi:hypothetical protein
LLWPHGRLRTARAAGFGDRATAILSAGFAPNSKSMVRSQEDIDGALDRYRSKRGGKPPWCTIRPLCRTKFCSQPAFLEQGGVRCACVRITRLPEFWLQLGRLSEHCHLADAAAVSSDPPTIVQQCGTGLPGRSGLALPASARKKFSFTYIASAVRVLEQLQPFFRKTRP